MAVWLVRAGSSRANHRQGPINVPRLTESRFFVDFRQLSDDNDTISVTLKTNVFYCF